MSEQTKIAWTDSTVNFWSGCTKVSAGCAHCYAETLSNRLSNRNTGNVGKWGKGAPRKLHESAFKLALKLNRKPWVCPVCGHSMTEGQSKGYRSCPTGAHFAEHHRRRIFSLSLGDWLDPEVPVEWLARMLDTIRQCPDVTWQLLTKRPELWRQRVNSIALLGYGDPSVSLRRWGEGFDLRQMCRKWVEEDNAPENVWVGTSVEDQEMADLRIPQLLKIPAEKRFLSVEPLLGPIELSGTGGRAAFTAMGPEWIIVGGESGGGARPCNVEWIRGIVKQCQVAGVACFVKQLGSKPFGPGRIDWSIIHHAKGGDPAEWPEDLRVRQFPNERTIA